MCTQFIRAQKALKNQFADKVQVVEKFNVPEKCSRGKPLVELAKEKCGCYLCDQSYGHGKTTKEELRNIRKYNLSGNRDNMRIRIPLFLITIIYKGAVYQGRYIAELWLA